MGIVAPVAVRWEEGESPRHVEMKRSIANGLAHFWPETEVRTLGGKRRADIVVRVPWIDLPVAIEVQRSKMQIKEYRARERDYAQARSNGRGMFTLWILEREAVDPNSPLEVGYERPVSGAFAMRRIACAEIIDKGFVHVMDGNELQIVTAEEVTYPIYKRWERRFEHRNAIRITAVHPIPPPFDIGLRADRYPRLMPKLDWA